MNVRLGMATIAALLTAAPAIAADTQPADPKAAVTPAEVAKAPPVVEQGRASYYSDALQGKPTASGEPHDQNSMTAASKDLPIGSKATVTNLENGKSVQVEVNDRGPYKSGRVIDLSKKAADDLGIDHKKGVARVEVKARAAEQPTPELQEKVAETGVAKQEAKQVAAAAPKKTPAPKADVKKAETREAAVQTPKRPAADAKTPAAKKPG